MYVHGLVHRDLDKNMERICEVVPDSTYQSLQHFLTDGSWEHSEVMDDVAVHANEVLGNKKDACLILDETSFSKKGKNSVGVARQYLGCVGKIDNGQVGMFTALCNGEHATLIQGKLYLPTEWTESSSRLEQAKVPAEDWDYQDKLQMALSQIKRCRGLGVEYGWIAADAGFGKGASFFKELEDINETFVIDVHRDFHVYKTEPKPHLPRKTNERGPKPKLTKVSAVTWKVETLCKNQSESSWKTITTRRGTKGDVTYQYLRIPVWQWDKGDKKVYQWQLIVRREVGKKTGYKYTITNAPITTRLKRLAFMQGQRYWVERSFQNGKTSCGMKDYQVRTWNGWHRHMSLVMMAMLFMIELAVANKQEPKNLTCRQIEMLLTKFLPFKKLTKEDELKAFLVQYRRSLLEIEGFD